MKRHYLAVAVLALALGMTACSSGNKETTAAPTTTASQTETEKAAEAEHASAQYALANIYLAGEAVAKDVTKATELFTRAAKQGHDYAAYQLGKQFLQGEETEKDVEAAKNMMFKNITQDNWVWNVAWWNDPVYLGQYPKEGLEALAAYLPEITSEDMELIHQPLDFIGMNIYNGQMVSADDQTSWKLEERYIGFPQTLSLIHISEPTRRS